MCEQQYHCEFNETASCFDIGIGSDQFCSKTRWEKKELEEKGSNSDPWIEKAELYKKLKSDVVETTSEMTTTIAMETDGANVMGAIPIDTMSIQNKIAEFDKIGVNF